MALVASSAMPLIAASCSSAQTLEGSGGRCFQVTDCQLGLACVPQPDGSRVCSNILTPIQMLPMGGADAAADAMPATDGNSVDGTTPDDTSSPVDTGSSPETSVPLDTGSPQEASPGNESGAD
jgi:hypothetical protein